MNPNEDRNAYLPDAAAIAAAAEAVRRRWSPAEAARRCAWQFAPAAVPTLLEDVEAAMEAADAPILYQRGAQ